MTRNKKILSLVIVAISTVVVGFLIYYLVFYDYEPTEPVGGVGVQGNEEISWVEAEQLVINCQAESVWQTHARAVTLVLKNGDRLETTEPNLDDIINIARAAEEKCGRIRIGTE